MQGQTQVQGIPAQGGQGEIRIFKQFMELVSQLPFNENNEFTVKLGDLEYFDGSRKIYDVELVIRKKEYLNKTDYTMTMFYTVFTRGIPKGIVPPELIEWGHRVHMEYFLDDPRDVASLIEWERKCGLLTKAVQTINQGGGS
mgnify:CR=1 FL=1